VRPLGSEEGDNHVSRSRRAAFGLAGVGWHSLPVVGGVGMWLLQLLGSTESWAGLSDYGLCYLGKPQSHAVPQFPHS
jgi:hypothetical protein